MRGNRTPCYSKESNVLLLHCQFNPHEVTHGEKSSVTRIVIEQFNRRVKERRFFRGVGQIHQKAMFSHVVFVVAMFSNFRVPIVGMD